MAEGGNAGSAGNAGSTATPMSLRFEGLRLEGEGDPPTLWIPPSDSYTLRVVADPPGVYPVRFGLLGTTGGASLNRSEATTDANGIAEVELTTPETVEHFLVRASVGTAVAKVQIVVGTSFATLKVQPSYAGKRPIVYWVAVARKMGNCDDPPLVPQDGDLVDQAIPTENPGEPQVPTLTLPTGSEFVVALRAAQYIQGCAIVNNDLEHDKVNELLVPVRDVPLKVAGVDLDLALKIDPATAKLDAVFDKAEALMFERFNKGQLSDVGTLLDAMAEATDPAQTSGFNTQRTRGGWDTWVAFSLGIASAPTELRRPLRAWFATARNELLEREMFSGRLLASALTGDSAELQLNRTFGYDPAAAGFPAIGRLSITAEPDDNLVVGGTINWFPTQLLGSVVSDVASASGAGGSSAPEALASELSCDKVARELVDHGSDPSQGQVFPGCNLGCATDLCKTAVQNLWKRMIDVTGSDTAKLVLSATGAAKVDDHANIASVTRGAWSASVDFATVTGKLTGGLEATAVPRQPPTQ
jgi:hypothetical protein